MLVFCKFLVILPLFNFVYFTIGLSVCISEGLEEREKGVEEEKMENKEKVRKIGKVEEEKDEKRERKRI